MVQPNAPAETVQATIDRLLNRGYVQTTEKVVASIVTSTNDPKGLIQQRLGELEAEARRLAGEGQKLKPDNAVLRALRADLDTVMGRNASRVDGVADDVQKNGVDVAGTVTRQLALPGLSDAQVRLAVGKDWNTPDPEAVNRLVGFVDSAGWSEELAQYGPDVVNVISNQAVQGFALGWSPMKTAGVIRQMTQGLPASTANTLMRTLQLESMRTGTAIHQNANADIIARVIRIESLDDRICMACIVLHGTVIWDSVRDKGKPIPPIQEHHNGRGTTVTDVLGTTANVGSGQDWFNGLNERKQRDLMRNDAAFEAWKAGKIDLQDFVEPYQDRVFGDMIRQASLNGMLGKDAASPFKK